MKKIIIIGGGIGGLATANLLARDGHDVHVYEKEPTLGGRANTFTKDGFTFDTGPSWYLMPDVFERYFSLLGEDVASHLELVKLTPAYKVFFEDTSTVTITGSLDRDSQTFEMIEPGAGVQLRRYVRNSDQTYRLALRHFLYTNFTTLRDLLKWNIIKRAVQLVRLMSTPIHRYVRRYFSSKKLQQILEYPMVFLGTSPFQAPALYSLMSALDFNDGVYYPKGTMYQVTASLVSIGKKLNVTYHPDSEVQRIATSDRRATSIVLTDGTAVDADIVVSNGDLHHTETKLLDAAAQSYPQSYWKRRQASPSAILLYLGVKGSIPEFEHHTLLFTDAWKENFDTIYGGDTLPHPASLYISKTSHSDATAPPGHENIFVLVPVPAGITLSSAELEQAADEYLEQIRAMTGVDLASRTVSRTLFGPDDFKQRYHSWQSSMLGPSHTLGQSAFFRTPNKSKKLSNLYYVGAGTVPGVGVPMCLIGAELVHTRIVAALEKEGRR